MTKKTITPTRGRRQRGSIDPDDIVAGAFELAEQVSLDNLSMPMLGRHLGVGVTSIYWHFRKKDDLLDAMTNRALRDYLLATPLPSSPDWRVMIYNYAHMMRTTFSSNPILADLIVIRAKLNPDDTALGARHIEIIVSRLVKAGLPLVDAVGTCSALHLHLRGSVVLSRLHDARMATEPGSRTYYDDLAVSYDSTPILAEAAARGHTGGAPNKHNFEFGLTCILDHAEQLIGATAGTQPPVGDLIIGQESAPMPIA